MKLLSRVVMTVVAACAASCAQPPLAPSSLASSNGAALNIGSTASAQVSTSRRLVVRAAFEGALTLNFGDTVAATGAYSGNAVVAVSDRPSQPVRSTAQLEIVVGDGELRGKGDGHFIDEGPFTLAIDGKVGGRSVKATFHGTSKADGCSSTGPRWLLEGSTIAPGFEGMSIRLVHVVSSGGDCSE